MVLARNMIGCFCAKNSLPSSMHIAIIENDRGILRSLEILLEDSGCDVVTFNHPRKAISYLRHRVIDTLILDYLMPEFTGKELLEQVKDYLAPSCRIVLVSGYMERIDKDLFIKLGVVGFLPKPIDLDKLCQLIEVERAV